MAIMISIFYKHFKLVFIAFCRPIEQKMRSMLKKKQNYVMRLPSSEKKWVLREGK